MNQWKKEKGSKVARGPPPPRKKRKKEEKGEDRASYCLDLSRKGEGKGQGRWLSPLTDNTREGKEKKSFGHRGGGGKEA